MEQATAKLKLIYTDIGGPITPASAEEARYWLTLIDNVTQSSWIYFFKEKKEALVKFKNFVTWIERQIDYKVKCLRSDNGREYDNKKAKNWLKGIRI